MPAAIGSQTWSHEDWIVTQLETADWIVINIGTRIEEKVFSSLFGVFQDNSHYTLRLLGTDFTLAKELFTTLIYSVCYFNMNCSTS